MENTLTNATAPELASASNPGRTDNAAVQRWMAFAARAADTATPDDCAPRRRRLTNRQLAGPEITPTPQFHGKANYVLLQQLELTVSM